MALDDQFSRQQDSVTSQKLVTDVYDIYRSCPVELLVPTFKCVSFPATDVENWHSYWTAVLNHSIACPCFRGWQTIVNRIWPWQEFVVAHSLRMVTGLGNSMKRYMQEEEILRGIAELAVSRLSMHPWQLADHAYYAGALRLMARLYAGHVSRRVTVFQIPLDHTAAAMAWMGRCRREATKKKDLLLAISPLLEIARSVELTGRFSNDVWAMVNAFCERMNLQYVGILTRGMLGETVASAHGAVGFMVTDKDANTATIGAVFQPCNFCMAVGSSAVGAALEATVEYMPAANSTPCEYFSVRQR